MPWAVLEPLCHPELTSGGREAGLALSWDSQEVLRGTAASVSIPSCGSGGMHGFALVCVPALPSIGWDCCITSRGHCQLQFTCVSASGLASAVEIGWSCRFCRNFLIALSGVDGALCTVAFTSSYCYAIAQSTLRNGSSLSSQGSHCWGPGCLGVALVLSNDMPGFLIWTGFIFILSKSILSSLPLHHPQHQHCQVTLRCSVGLCTIALIWHCPMGQSLSLVSLV